MRFTYGSSCFEIEASKHSLKQAERKIMDLVIGLGPWPKTMARFTVCTVLYVVHVILSVDILVQKKDKNVAALYGTYLC